MATVAPSPRSGSTVRRWKVQGAVATNTLVLSLFMRRAELGTTTSVLSGPITVTVANMLGLSA